MYIPPQIIKGIPVRSSADIVDRRVDTDKIMMIHAFLIVQTNKENVVDFLHKTQIGEC